MRCSATPASSTGATCEGIVESELLAKQAEELSHAGNGGKPSDGAARSGAARRLEVGGRRFDVTVLVPEPPHAELARRRRERAAHGPGGAGSEAVVSPMQGTVLDVRVAEGDEVEAGQVICIVEAMKMENEIVAHRTASSPA